MLSSASSAVPSAVSSKDDDPPFNKRRKVEEPQMTHNTSRASNLQVLHQATELSLLYLRHPQSSWHAQGRTTLYVINDDPGNFAMHLRGSCQVLNVTVETLKQTAAKTNKAIEVDDGAPPSHVSLVSVPVAYQHTDPLGHILVKPVQSQSPEGYHADSHWIRGATGMTLGLRAASIASLMGELRISPSGSSNTTNEAQVSKDDAIQYWMHDLQASSSKEGEVAEELTTKLHTRSIRAREARIQLVAQRLAEASQDSKDTDKAKVMKVTVVYEVALDRMPHLGGIHSSHGQTPHVYTTAGVFGDHEGPRTWVPCLDSASSKHRASHELIIRVTAPMRDGLSVVGCGEDFGVTKTLLHDMSIPPRAAQLLGSSHVQMVNNIVAKVNQNEQASEDDIAPHVIPPDPSSIDSVLATTVWASQVWTPAPIRSVGFAVGPFKILEDPEYFSGENDDDEDVEEENETDQNAFIEATRENGEGIRQAYFAPLYERKYIHVSADMTLLQQTTFELPQISQRFVEASRDLDQAVIVSTAGVTLRALSLFRDVLALPTYRTSSYTQIWIPDAVHGGSTSGALHCCPEVFVNPFIGGSILDARLLSPVGSRLPYYNGGRVLQMIQARCVVRGWITAALPLGGDDDIGFGYIHTLIESFLMSIYERGHGAFGEGGAKSSLFFTRRYATKSGLNSSALDFLPVANIEEAELEAVAGGVVGGLPIEDRSSDQLWRTASNGTESHTSALDELGVRQVLYKDSVEALERATDKKNHVALPSTGYLGSHLSLSFLSTNASSSSDLGCGAVDLLHPVGGMTYRVLKSELLQRVVEGRAGIANCVRLIRAAFIAAHLEDSGKKELKDEDWQRKPKRKKTTEKAKADEKGHQATDQEHKIRPPFLLCVDELLKKHGLTHALFTRALRIMAGPTREPLLRGSLVDVERETRMPVNGRHYVEPEGFPNSYVRGASELYLRVGAHVEPAGGGDATGLTPSGAPKGTVLQLLAEPVIPEGAISYGGPITVRVVENEGQLREFARSMNVDGSRCDWGPIFLHAKPVTTTKQQNAASGGIETGRSSKPSSKSSDGDKGGASAGDSNTAHDAIFSDSCLHNGGYQAIELARLTNRTPLLWVRVDTTFSYGGRIAIVQPDACIAEQLFHDGDAGAQVDALRALAERPFRIQGSVKIATVYGADVSELPVRVIGDCLRGSPALHSSLPHTPAIRAQAAYAIAQWQNNKEATNKLVGKTDSWIGLKLLVQYFRERFDDNGSIIPISFARVVVKKSEDQMGQTSNDAGVGSSTTGEDALYQYLDTVETAEERHLAVKEAEDIEIEEDEEYRVRSAVVQAIASIRADDGTTPPSVLRFLEEVLQSGDSSMIGTFVSGVGDFDTHRLSKKDESDLKKRGLRHDDSVASLNFYPSIMVADALLSLCSVNASTAPATHPATAQQEVAKHPSLPLISTCYRWLEWALYRETLRSEAESSYLTGVGGGTQSTVAACAVTALSSLCILKQSTTDPVPESVRVEHRVEAEPQSEESVCDVASSTLYYKAIFDGEPLRNDVTRAACAQAVACIYCAADRVKIESKEPLGLLNALVFLLERILDPRTSPGLRQTLALLMMDASTGKICSTQRVAAVGGRGDLCTSAARLLTGPLGSSYGGDNGSALLMSVNEISYPAANAVNDGARRGLALLKVAGGMNDDKTSNQSIVRIAKFATSLWRTINGDCAPPPSATASRVLNDAYGICSYDGLLRCSLLSLWQWLWPSRCFAVMRVQTWEKLMGKQQYEQLGANLVMHSTEAEMKAANEKEKSLAVINQIVEKEIDRQKWRGEMASKACEYYQYDKARKVLPDTALTIDQGVGQPLPMIVRDAAFKQGGWIASAAQQRRADKLDGGCKVTAVRLKMKSSSALES